MFLLFLWLFLGFSELAYSSTDSVAFLDDSLSPISLDDGLSPSNLFVDDASLSALVSNAVDSNLDTSQGSDLFSNDRIINPELEDTIFDGFDEYSPSGPFSGSPEIASNSCDSKFLPSRKIRKRENAECSSSDPRGSTPTLPSLDANDLLQEAQKRRFCSRAGVVGMEFTLVCAYTGNRADENTFWHVTGHACECLAARDLLFEFLRRSSIN